MINTPHCACAAIMRESTREMHLAVGDRSYGPYPCAALACTQCDEFWVSALELSRVERLVARAALSKISGPYGAALKFARKALGLAQHEFADRIGMSKGFVGAMESDREGVELTTRLAVMRVLDEEERK